MHYKKFVIRNYRAITGPIEISVEKKSLLPIIGINESGKTTILHALFAFDCYNDALNAKGRHLKDTANLYRTVSPDAIIEAEIWLSRRELNNTIDDTIVESQNPELKSQLATIRRKYALPSELVLRRNLNTQKYLIPALSYISLECQDILTRSVIQQLPYILFFDDFRDKIDEKIEIILSEDKSPTGWLAMVEQLFKQTDNTLSVFLLPNMEERQRKSVLAKVQRRLNETITKEWQNFRLDDRDALRISVDFHQDRSTDGVIRNFIKLEIIETDIAGDQHYFFISDRSKGFYWFFNFVMKLEFNPKVVDSGGNTIYLLDEPGSYLHSTAQRKLCTKLLQLSRNNMVIYCTHSHYLLNPETIPVSSIAITEKDATGAIKLVPITRYKGTTLEKRSALQPVWDALHINPFVLDMIGTRTTVITEGIYDYFALELFRNDRQISILPSVGAESIKFYVSLFIAWRVEFRALWDNDTQGKDCFKAAVKLFGDGIADRSFRILPSPAGKKCILQDLFEGDDLVMLRKELELSADCSFERTIHVFFYSSSKTYLQQRISTKTRKNFQSLYDSLSLE